MVNPAKKLNREYLLKLNSDIGLAAEVRKFEERYTKQLGMPMTLSDFSLGDVIKKCETVGFNDELITQKVYESVIRGAEDDEALLTKIARVVEMDSETMVLPIITPDDFKIYPAGTGLTRTMGGVFDRVKLDCSVGRGLYKGDLGFEDWWAKSNRYGAMEEALWAAGNATAKDILTKVIVDLETDVAATMTNALANWGNNHYKALIKAVTVIEAKGMHPNFVVCNPDEMYDILTTDVFIHQDYARAAVGGLPSGGSQIGSLFGRIPIYCHRAATAASITVGVREKAAYVGMYQGINIEDYRDVREGLEGSILSVQYDYKNGSNAEMTKGTQYAWSKITAA